MTIEGMPPMTMKVYKKDDKLRLETETKNIKIITIKKGQETIIYYPDKKMAMVMTGEDIMGQDMGQGQNLEDLRAEFDKEDKKKIGEENILGEKCDIFEYSTEDGKHKIWLSKKSGMALKAESQTPKGTMRMEIKNLNLNLNLSDSLFEIPQGVQVQNVGKMMQGLKQNLGDLKDKYKGELPVNF